MNLSGIQDRETMWGTTEPNMEKQKKPRTETEETQKCPRCQSTNTKFCYYNNYSLSQPRYFCKSCRRYWTKGGTLRKIPVGGGCRKNRTRSTASSTSSLSLTNMTVNRSTQVDPIGYHHNQIGLNFAVSLIHKQSLNSDKEFLRNPSGFPFDLTRNGENQVDMMMPFNLGYNQVQMINGESGFNGMGNSDCINSTWNTLVNSPLMQN